MSWHNRGFRGIVWTHGVVLAFVGILVPLASQLLGSGELAYAMYARTEELRMDVFAIDRAGLRHRLPPTELAHGARQSLLPMVAGSEHWRTTPRIGDLRNTLRELAGHACTTQMAAGAQSVEIILEERAREGGPIRTTRAVAPCMP